MERAEILYSALRKGTLKPAQVGPNDAALLKTYITSQRQPAAPAVRPQPVPAQPAPQPVVQPVVKPTPIAKTGMGYVREAELKPPTEEELTRFARPYTPPVEKLTPEQRVALPAQSKILPSLTAGIGDVIATAGGAAKWLGAKKTGERLVAKGEQMRKAHEIPTEEFSWRQLLDPNFYTTNVMRSVPFSAALIPAAVAGAYGLGTAGAAMGLGAFGKAVLGAVGGGLLNRAMEGAMEAGGTYNEAIAKGMTPEQADKAAQQTFKKNLALAGMDIGEFATAFVPIPGAKTLGKAGKIALGAGRLAATAGQEAIEEGIQEVIQRRSLGETAPVSELLKQPQTQEAMTIGAIHGGGLGAAGTAFTEIKSRVIAKLPSDVQSMVNTAVKQMEAAGVPKDRAEVQALDAVAETPQGQKAIQDAVNEVKETAEAKPEAVKPTPPVAEAKPEAAKPTAPVEAVGAALAGAKKPPKVKTETEPPAAVKPPAKPTTTTQPIYQGEEGIPIRIVPVKSGVEAELSSEVDKVVEEVSPPVGLSIKIVKNPPPTKGEGFKFSDAATEARYQRSHEGVQREGFWTQIQEIGRTLRNKISREYEHLPRTGEFAPLRYEGLLPLAKQKSVSGDRTVRLQQGIISKMLKDPATFNLFERKVLLDDLAEEMDAGHDLPLGFTKETLPKEVERLNQEIAKHPEIADALQKRSKAWDAIKKDYTKAMKAIGFDVEKRFTKKNYFRHQVLEYANTRAVSGTGQRIKTPTGRGFLKAREGSTYDINTNYLQADFEVMAQMLYDIEVAKVIRLVQGKQYNIASKVKEEYTKRLERLLIKVSDNDETAIDRLKFGMRENDIPMVAYDNTLKSKIEKLQPGAVKKAGLEDWRSLVPDGYEIWQPREGNVFYFVDSIPSQMAQQLMEGKAEEIGVKSDNIRQALAMGSPRREFVVKSEVAKTLDNFGRKATVDPVSKAVRTVMGGWKEYQLINPKRVVKYNARNLSGDAEAVFLGNPSTFKKVGQAASELYQTLYGDRSMTPTMRDWFERGGMESTLQVAELGDINQLRMFSKLFEDKRSIPKKMWDSYVRSARLGTDFRESILRYAAYLDYLEQMQKTGKPNNFGASIPEEIMALKDVKDRAFVLSNQLLGAYDQVSVAGQAIRTYLAPFWSWKEVNAKRYVQLVRNAASDGKLANMAGRTLTSTLKRSPLIAFRVGKFLIKASGLWAMLTAFNNLKFPDEERELPEDVRSKPHIVLGRDKDGKVRYFDRLGILGDFLEWFGLDAPSSLVVDYLNGRKTLKDCAIEMVKAPINTFWQALGPHVKTPVELLMGKKTYPDVYRPSTIRDKWLYLAESVGLGDEYKALTNMPARPYADTLQNIVASVADPGESSYYDILDEKNEYMRKAGKGSDFGAAVNPRSRALYYLKMAVRYGDKAAFEKYLAEYVTAGGSEKGYEASVRSMDPLYGLTASEKKDFKKEWLDDEGRRKLKLAQEFYEEVIEKGEKIPGATRSIKKELPSKPKK